MFKRTMAVVLFFCGLSAAPMAQVHEGDVELGIRGALGHSSQTIEASSGEQDADVTGILPYPKCFYESPRTNM